ncbi:hypothetical protein [Nitratireductor sp. XY-223]|uniref:hypothetical protein n=1 Tax=Nitratireductor sp. XY-223 TaxID=2561926 RepID=UPI0010AA6750|nr:hypothetical protein [Nitratireductor sp. XY-223]
MTHIMSDGTPFCFCDIGDAECRIDSIEEIHSTLLLTAWRPIELLSDKLEDAIRRLLSKGAINVICIGQHSEALHDLIDDVIVSMSSDEGSDLLDSVTVWIEAEEFPGAVRRYIYKHEFDTENEDSFSLIFIGNTDDRKDKSVFECLMRL